MIQFSVWMITKMVSQKISSTFLWTLVSTQNVGWSSQTKHESLYNTQDNLHLIYAQAGVHHCVNEHSRYNHNLWDNLKSVHLCQEKVEWEAKHCFDHAEGDIKLADCNTHRNVFLKKKPLGMVCMHANYVHYNHSEISLNHHVLDSQVQPSEIYWNFQPNTLFGLKITFSKCDLSSMCALYFLHSHGSLLGKTVQPKIWCNVYIYSEFVQIEKRLESQSSLSNLHFCFKRPA